MATFKFYIPAINLMGAGCLQEAAADIQGHGYRKALIVTDKILGQIGVVGRLAALLAEHGIDAVVFDETRPNCSPPRKMRNSYGENDYRVEHGIYHSRRCRFRRE